MTSGSEPFATFRAWTTGAVTFCGMAASLRSRPAPLGCRRCVKCTLAALEGESGAACENCDRDDDDLAPVHRIYVVPESWDTAASATTLEDVEWWCFSCRTQYPHEEVS